MLRKPSSSARCAIRLVLAQLLRKSPLGTPRCWKSSEHRGANQATSAPSMSAPLTGTMLIQDLSAKVHEWYMN